LLKIVNPSKTKEIGQTLLPISTLKKVFTMNFHALLESFE
jgi:hypothetical protein